MHFISIRQVSSDTATLQHGRCRHCCIAASPPLLPPPLVLLCIGNLMVKNRLLLTNYDLSSKSDTVQLWRMLSSICTATFNDDRFCNDKALVLWKSDNKNNPRIKNNVGSAWEPISWSNNITRFGTLRRWWSNVYDDDDDDLPQWSRRRRLMSRHWWMWPGLLQKRSSLMHCPLSHFNWPDGHSRCSAPYTMIHVNNKLHLILLFHNELW